MHYSFNSMLGRVSSTTKLSAYNPQGMQATVKESKPLVFATKNTKLASETASPMFSSKAANEPVKGYVPKISKYTGVQELQNFMTLNDHALVWQKRLPDRPLLMLSTLVTVGGLLLVGRAVYNMSFGVNKKD